MKIKRLTKIIGAVLGVAMMAAVPDAASALTASGVSIANKATVNYQVNAISQTAIESSPTGNTTPGVGNGTNTTFLVDDKVVFTVTANDGGAVTTYPGSSAQAMKFTVANTGNTTHDFVVTASQIAGFTFTPTSIALYADTNANGTYEAGTDLALPVSAGSAYIDELAAGSSAVVFVVSTTPLTALNGQVSNYSLMATAHQGGGAAALGALTASTAGADTPGSVDIVLAEVANVTPVNAANNGQYIVNGVTGFTVSAASLTITKTSAVYSDPINGTTTPKAIPGAVVTYTITIANAAGAANATSVSISDSLAAEITATHIAYNTAYNDGVLTCAAGSGINVGGVCKTNAADVDNADFTANVVNVTGLTVNAGTSTSIKYQVTVQ